LNIGHPIFQQAWLVLPHVVQGCVIYYAILVLILPASLSAYGSFQCHGFSPCISDVFEHSLSWDGKSQYVGYYMIFQDVLTGHHKVKAYYPRLVWQSCHQT